MSSRPRPPTIQQLTCDPELAILAALDWTSELTRAALLAQHQNIGHEAPEDVLTMTACSIIDTADSLRILLRRYRAALARHHRNMDF